MSGDPQKILLVCEGQDDERFLKHFIEFLGLGAGVEVRFPFSKEDRQGGKDKITATYLKTSKQEENVSKLIVLVDADADPDSERKKFSRILTDLGQSAGDLFLMPNNCDSGELEDLCLATVSETAEMTCVNQYLSCMQEEKKSRYRKIAKAKALVYLAGMDFAGDGVRGVGMAAKSDRWDLEHTAFDPLRDFLRRAITGDRAI